MARAEQCAITMKEGGADRYATLVSAENGFVEGGAQHRDSEISLQRWSLGMTHSHQYAPLVNSHAYTVEVGTQTVQLPLVTLSADLTLALLITVDMGVAFIDRAGAELADLLRPHEIDIVATVATMGIPVAAAVTRHLGLDQYVVLHKTPKIHLANAVSEPVRSITTASEQRLLFDRARIDAVAGQRVAIVDDVVSTGASIGAALRLLRGIGADVVAIGALVTEASLWRDSLGEDANKVRALGQIPVFRPDGRGGLVEDWHG